MGSNAVAGLHLTGLPVENLRTPGFLYRRSGWRPDAVFPRRPILLDACAGEGGAAVGFYTAGFDVVGVDKDPQPHYPFEFIQADAVEFTREYGHLFDVRHGSPPCQNDSKLKALVTRDYPRLIGPLRDAFLEVGGPYVIENVEGARAVLRDPITLCMSTWARRSYRHRLFESNVRLVEPPHFDHAMRQAKLGRAAAAGEAFQAMGNFPQVAMVRRQMEMPWASRRGIAESIPPIFSEYVGRQLMAHLIDAESAALV